METKSHLTFKTVPTTPFSVVASVEMRRRRRSKRGNHAALRYKVILQVGVTRLPRRSKTRSSQRRLFYITCKIGTGSVVIGGCGGFNPRTQPLEGLT